MQFLGNLERVYSIGTNNLIKNGAYLITSGMDILEMYPKFLNRKKRKINLKNNLIENNLIKNNQIKDNKLKNTYNKIYSCLSNEFLSIDLLARKSKKTLREVINIITLMEIDGLVEFEFGKGYKIKD